MALVELSVDGLQELTGCVLGLARQQQDGRPLWFRGLSCSAHELIPSLMRDAESIEAVLDRERRLLTRFRQRSLPYWPAGYPQTEWEHMFAMQHHGVPTRLLDWSENLFLGLYFALNEPRTHGPKGAPHSAEECHPVLWCLDPIGWNRGVPQLKDFGPEISILTTADEELIPYEPETPRERLRKRQNTPVAAYGTHNSARIVAQRGTFTVAGKSLEALDTFADEVSQDPVLWRIAVAADRDQLSRDIAGLGFTESMIYPDLGGLSRELDFSEGWRA